MFNFISFSTFAEKAARFIALAGAVILFSGVTSSNAVAEKNQQPDLAGAFVFANGATMAQLTDEDTSATVTLSNLNVTYDAKSQAAVATTVPAGLKVSITYNGKSTKPINAGSYAVVASVTSTGYTGSTTGTMVVAPEPCTITFTKLTFTYDGDAQKAQAKTSPSAAGATFTYNGSSTAPTLVGSYSVVATAKSSNYTGTESGTETITPIAPKVSDEGTSVIGAFSATLKAKVNPKGSSTTVYFQYGTTSSYGTNTSTQTVAAGTTSVEVTAAISGLQTTTKYHFRAVAVNGGGTKNGADTTFTTAKAPILGSTTSASVGASGGEVLGTVTPNGVKTTAYFQYGTSLSYGLTTTMQDLGSGKSAVAVDGIFPNLQPNTTYYYQLVTTGSAGTFYGATGSFTTLSFDTSLIQATGNPAPVPNVTGATFAAFGIPIVNNTVDYAYFAQLTISGSITSSNNLSIFKDDSSSALAYVTRTGDLAPGTASATYSSVSNPVYNDNHDVAYEGLLKVVSGQATSSTDQGIWSDSSGSLQLVAREGSQAPNCPANANFLEFYSIALPNTGGALIFATLNSGSGSVNSTNNTGIWRGNSTSDLALVQRSGDVVGGRTISAFNFLTASAYVGGQTRNFTPTGDLAFQATFTDGSSALVKNISGTSGLAYESGEGAPGTQTSGAVYSGFDNPIINANDHLAFAAGLNTGIGGVTTSDDFGIYAENSSGALQAIAQTGGSAPGTSSTFEFLSDPVYNKNEAVAFRAQLNDAGSVTSANNLGLWSNVSGSLQLMAQTNEQAPGCPSGVLFNDFQALALPDVGGSNNQGGLIFLAALTASTAAGVDSSNDLGIWAVDPNGTLQLIVRTGDQLSVNGTLKTVTTINFLSSSSAYSPGQSRNFSASTGQIIYVAGFSDGTSAICGVTFP